MKGNFGEFWSILSLYSTIKQREIILLIITDLRQKFPMIQCHGEKEKSSFYTEYVNLWFQL